MEKNKHKRTMPPFLRFLLQLGAFALVLWVLFFKIVGFAVCPTEDMHPRIDQGDIAMYYRLDRDIRAQDVIVLEKAPEAGAEKQLYMLRVVAVAGDKVEIGEGGGLVVNGNRVSEPDIYFATRRYEQFTDYPVELQAGQVFALADSRDGGVDSRYFGPIDAEEILGSVITIARRAGF